ARNLPEGSPKHFVNFVNVAYCPSNPSNAGVGALILQRPRLASDARGWIGLSLRALPRSLLKRPLILPRRRFLSGIAAGFGSKTKTSRSKTRSRCPETAS